MWFTWCLPCYLCFFSTHCTLINCGVLLAFHRWVCSLYVKLLKYLVKSNIWSNKQTKLWITSSHRHHQVDLTGSACLSCKMTARQWGKISLASLCFLADALIELHQSPAANSAAKSTSVICAKLVRQYASTQWKHSGVVCSSVCVWWTGCRI